MGLASGLLALAEAAPKKMPPRPPPTAERLAHWIWETMQDLSEERGDGERIPYTWPEVLAGGTPHTGMASMIQGLARRFMAEIRQPSAMLTWEEREAYHRGIPLMIPAQNLTPAGVGKTADGGMVMILGATFTIPMGFFAGLKVSPMLNAEGRPDFSWDLNADLALAPALRLVVKPSALTPQAAIKVRSMLPDGWECPGLDQAAATEVD